MKYALCFLAFILLILDSCKDKLKIDEDQSTSFVKFYGNLWEDNGYDVKSIPVSQTFPNGGYVVAGSTSITSQGGNLGTKQMLFLILDKYGNIVGRPKQFGGSGDDEARRVDILSNGAGFVLTGYITAGGQRHASIMRLSASGDSVWNYISNITNSSAEEAFSLHIDSLTNIYTVVGYQTINSQQNGWIFDLQDNGENYSYDSSSSAILPITNIQNVNSSSLNVAFNDIGFLNSPYISLFGSFSSSATPIATATSKSVVFVAKKQGSYNVYNSDGSTAVIRNSNDYARQMILLPGNKAAYLGSIDTTIGSSTRSIRLVLFDNPASPPGSVIRNWYFSNDNGSLDAIKMKYNAGDNTFTILATLTSSALNSIVLIKADGTNGQQLWRHSFGENNDYGAGGLDLTPDGGYIITGYNNTGAYNRSVLIIKTNKDGFIE